MRLLQTNLGWASIFHRTYAFGYSRSQLNSMFLGMPPIVRHAVAAVSQTMRELVEVKR